MNRLVEGVSQGSISYGPATGAVNIPAEVPILPLNGAVVFPLMIARIGITDEKSKELIEDAMKSDRLIGVFFPKPEEETNSKKARRAQDGVYPVGTICNILQMLRIPDGSIRLFLHGLARVSVTDVKSVKPYMKASIKVVDETHPADGDLEVEAMMKLTLENLQRAINMSALSEELAVAALNVEGPGRMADLVASNLPVKPEDLLPILEESNTKDRLRMLQNLLAREIHVMEIGNRINEEVREEVDRSQRSFFLQQQMKAIRKELGETDPHEAEMEQLEHRIAQTDMPAHARTVTEREFQRLVALPTAAAEYGVIRTYLEWILDIPWMKSTDDHIDLQHAAEILDQDHYGLEKVKERILEYLSVIRLKGGNLRGPILCLVGPPGVGKTSLGRSVARATGRHFQNFSLGGMRDEAEIRGHRRTYVGAMPGRIVKALKEAGVNNPLVMLDEVDKLGSDFRGDPASALLEVLDPEQNFHFTDHYMDMPVDLSKVMFITTANTLDTIPEPLKDRMEIIRLAGYTEMEKQEIASKYLVPREIENSGLTTKQISFQKTALRAIINDYTHEAGVRKLQQEVGSICRKVARRVAEYDSWSEKNAVQESTPAKKKALKSTPKKKAPAKPAGPPKPERVQLTPENISEYLGAKRTFQEVAERMGRPGIAVGLAWTSVGGEILFIEAAEYVGTGGLKLTGQLGDVMKESAQAALTFLKANSGDFGIDPERFRDREIHVHVPAGATPKDGPSAGLAMATAIASLLTGRPVRDYLAMTGEITLRGNVLPVGGIKEKCLAARRAGIKEIFLPHHNEREFGEVPDAIKKGLKVKYFEFAKDLVREALRK